MLLDLPPKPLEISHWLAPILVGRLMVQRAHKITEDQYKHRRTECQFRTQKTPQYSLNSGEGNVTMMFDMESMPDLLKPCGIVYSKNFFDAPTRSDDNYQLVQDILVPKTPEFLNYNHEGGGSLFEAQPGGIPLEQMTPVTPPFSIETGNSESSAHYANIPKVTHHLKITQPMNG